MANVTEIADKDGLLIDGQEYDAFIDNLPCRSCSELRIYSYRYDAYFCAHCNYWIEDACSDSTCEFCANRPIAPIIPPVADQQ